MSDIILYLKCDRNIVCTQKDVYMKDIGSVYCEEKTIMEHCKSTRIYHFRERQFVVVDVLKIIEIITREIPGTQVVNLGEEEVILEPAYGQNTKKNKPEFWKTVFVSCICFFGTGFTIMAFQNDVGVNNVFERVYEILMGEESKGLTVLQSSYAVGLLLGILLFFNHFGSKKLSSDPTPIQVSMKNYEDDVNNTLVKLANREGKEENV